MGSVGNNNFNYVKMNSVAEAENYYTALGKNIKLTLQQNQTLEEYKIQSGELNTGLRNDTISEKDYRLKDIDKAINKFVLPDNIVVYRSIPSSVLGVTRISEAVGKTISDKAYFSTTLNPLIMQKFVNAQSNGVGVIIKVNAGTKALPMSSVRTNKGLSEQEILFSRNTKIKITGTKDVRGKTYLIAEMK